MIIQSTENVCAEASRHVDDALPAPTVRRDSVGSEADTISSGRITPGGKQREGEQRVDVCHMR